MPGNVEHDGKGDDWNDVEEDGVSEHVGWLMILANCEVPLYADGHRRPDRPRQHNLQNFYSRFRFINPPFKDIKATCMYVTTVQ